MQLLTALFTPCTATTMGFPPLPGSSDWQQLVKVDLTCSEPPLCLPHQRLPPGKVPVVAGGKGGCFSSGLHFHYSTKSGSPRESKLEFNSRERCQPVCPCALGWAFPGGLQRHQHFAWLFLQGRVKARGAVNSPITAPALGI